MQKQTTIDFQAVQVGASFEFNGAQYVKTGVLTVIKNGRRETELDLGAQVTITKTAPDETASTIGAVKKGEYIRLKSGGPVWIRGDYLRGLNKYEIYKADDVNHFSAKSASTVCFIGFDY